MRVRFTPEATEELSRVVTHYAGQRDGLGDEFVDAVDAMAREIAAWPLAGRPFDASIRGRILGRFPYWILYQQRGSTIWITSLVHQNRGEAFWRSRWGVRDESAGYVPQAA
jgi:toxin ParE1/3/4